MIRLGKSDLPRDIERLVGEDVIRCNQCAKCTAGCPMGPDMDIMPNQIMRLAQLGEADRLLRSRAIWMCASCEMCATRCPMDLSLAEVMDALRQMSLERGLADKSTRVPQFHEAFLGSVRKHGRAHELGLIGSYKVKTHRLFDDIGLGLRMFRQGKLRLIPHNIRGREDVQRILGKDPTE